MKKTFILVATAVLWLSASSFAANVHEQLTEKALVAFAKKFPYASNVKWHDKGSFYMVDFKVGGTNFNAAYNADGELLASSKSIALYDLPLEVTVAVNVKYADYEMGNNAQEMYVDGQTFYYLTIANNKQVLQIKVSAEGSITVERKTKF